MCQSEGQMWAKNDKTGQRKGGVHTDGPQRVGVLAWAYPVIPQALVGTFSSKPLLDNCNNYKNCFIALSHILNKNPERILVCQI